MALDDEGYLWLMPVSGDEDTPTRRLGHVEDDPPFPDALAAELEPDKERLAAERMAEPTRQDLEREWRGDHLAGLPRRSAEQFRR